MAEEKVPGFLRRIFSSKVLPSWTILIFDIFIVAVSVLIGYLIRTDFSFVMGQRGMMWASVGVIVAVDVIYFRVFRTYSNVLRLSSFVDLMNLFAAQSLSMLTVLVADITIQYTLNIQIVPVSVLVISYLVCFVLMVTMRLIIKSLYDELSHSSSERLPVFVYGTRGGGAALAKSLPLNSDHNFTLKGFISDDPSMAGKVLLGANVYLNNADIAEHLREKKVRAVIVIPDKMEALHETGLADILLKENIRLYVAKQISDSSSTEDGFSGEIKAVDIEDLLMRDPIQIDMDAIRKHLEGKRVLITGAAGSIGSEIMRQVASFNPYQLILVDQAETPLHDIRLELENNWRNIDAPTVVADISSRDRMEQIFNEYRPEFVFHAAAYKHVPMMEDNVSESIQNNVLGTKVLADLSVKYGVKKFVMISTDKAVNPSNVMGCSKRICEIYVQSLAKKIASEEGSTQFITTRFGNVLGSNGSVIPLFRKQIEAGGPVTVTHPDIIRYFMTIPEACRLVLEAGSMGQGGEIYIFDMGEPVKIVDLAKKMITLSGRTGVKIEFTGLRHGEKLYEELLATSENTTATSHDKIMIAKVREYDFDEVSKRIEGLIRASYDFDEMKTVALMKDIVPEFKSLNSRFSKLDK
ncbi:MAG: polysaccharide biosynthesis protein [Bacteroidales bacterium]|nr:polysaccharide biosynthesis protein [Bacteroidales bacterium]